jgi:D-glutamate cyclase
MEHLLQVEMRRPGLPKGAITPFYRAARRDGPPLLYEIGTEVLSRTHARVAIFTGVVVPGYLDIGEIDGPPGAAVLAAALGGLGHDVSVFVEPPQTEVMRRLCAVTGVSHPTVGSTADRPEADACDIAIAIEKIGMNAVGKRHSVLGAPLTAMGDGPDAFFEDLARAGALTIGIGDGGNEIGFGAIADDVRRILGDGSRCACGCPDGIVTSTPAKLVLPAAISNLGAYAVAAALAVLERRPELCPEPAVIHELLETAVAGGLLDGGTLAPGFLGDDGVPAEAVEATVCLLRTVVSQELSNPVERPF